MISFLIGVLVFIAAGVGLTRWLRNGHQAQQEAPVRRGAEQLAQLRWRDFARLVLQTMHGRGYRAVVEEGGPSDGIPTDGSDILLARGDERALLSCQYGSGSVVAAQIVASAAATASLRGADSVIVVTPGQFDPEAKLLVLKQQVELIDGEALWPEVRPYVAKPEEPVLPTAQPVLTGKTLGFAWGGAAIAGALAWAIAGSIVPHPEPEPEAVATAPVAAATPAKPVATANNDRAAAAGLPPGVPTDTRELDQRRKEAANAIATLFGVSRALWSSQSTLMVYLSSPNADPMNDLCPLLVQYPELAASRIQLQPPEGSDKPVRFTRCRAY